MDKKKEEVYGIGIVFLLLSILLSIFTGNQAINSGWNMSTWVLVVVDGVSGVFGIGCLLKPDSFGAVILRLIENYQKSQAEGSNSSSRQTQKQTSDSVQVNARDDAEVHVSVSPRDKKRAHKPSTEEVTQNAKTFSCPRGHRITVYQPDDNHPRASLEEDYAKKYAIGTVIQRKYTCQDCGSEITLYWYREGSGAGVF
jgi:hypothetical protein